MNASMFGVKRSEVKVTASPTAQQAEAYRAQYYMSSCNFLALISGRFVLSLFVSTIELSA